MFKNLRNVLTTLLGSQRCFCRFENRVGTLSVGRSCDTAVTSRIVIGNFKRFLLGTPHGVSGHCLHEYIYEFVYRFNRRLWQLQLPQRLLDAAANHIISRSYSYL